jgi:hypothetical protein
VVSSLAEQVETGLGTDFSAAMRAETKIYRLLRAKLPRDPQEDRAIASRVVDALITQSYHPSMVRILARVVVAVGDEETIDRLVAGLLATLRKKVRDERRWAAEVASAILQADCYRQEMFEMLIALFADRDRKLAKIANEAIARFGHKSPDFSRLTPALLSELTSPHPESRYAATSALSHAACDGIVLHDDAVAALQTLANNGNKEAALAIIGHNVFRGAPAQAVLLHVTKEDGGYIPAELARRFKRNNAHRVVALVALLLDHHDVSTRISAAKACGELSSTADLEPGAPQLVSLLCDSTYWAFGRTSPGEAASDALLVWLHRCPGSRASVVERVRLLRCDGATAKKRVKALLATLES